MNPEGSFNGKTQSFDTRSAFGFLWLRDTDSNEANFPDLGEENYTHLVSRQYKAPAPYQIVMDIFMEAEHTADAHFLLGFDKNRRNEVFTQTRIEKDRIVIDNVGPQKLVKWPLTYIMPFKKGDFFNDTLTTEFSPIYTRYDHFWFDPNTQFSRSLKLKYYMFFKPRDIYETDVFLLGFASTPLLKIPYVEKLASIIMTLVSDIEMKMDMNTLSQIADKSTSIENHCCPIVYSKFISKLAE